MDLPLVKEECCWPIERELADPDFLNNYANHIVEQNPIIALTLGVFIDKLPHCCKGAAIIAASVTYRLLENQAESDRMNKELKYEEL